MKDTLQSKVYNVLLVKSTYMKVYQATVQCLKLQLFISLSEQFLYDFIYLFYSSQNGQLHKKNVKSHQKKVRELKKCIRLKEQENYELSLQLKEMLVSVSERMHIFKAAGESSDALQGTKDVQKITPSLDSAVLHQLRGKECLSVTGCAQ